MGDNSENGEFFPFLWTQFPDLLSKRNEGKNLLETFGVFQIYRKKKAPPVQFQRVALFILADVRWVFGSLSRYAQNPTLDENCFKLIRIQRGIEKTGKGTFYVGGSHPCRRRVSIVLIPGAVFSRIQVLNMTQV